MERFFRYTEPTTNKVMLIDVYKALSEPYINELTDEWRLCLKDVKEMLDEAEKEHPDLDIIYVMNDTSDPEHKNFIWHGFKIK